MPMVSGNRYRRFNRKPGNSYIDPATGNPRDKGPWWFQLIEIILALVAVGLFCYFATRG